MIEQTIDLVGFNILLIHGTLSRNRTWSVLLSGFVGNRIFNPGSGEYVMDSVRALIFTTRLEEKRELDLVVYSKRRMRLVVGV